MTHQNSSTSIIKQNKIFISAILNSLCQEFLTVNVSAILYLMNYEKYGRSTASAQYFLQLAGYLGIPVIAWNADNSGLERVNECSEVNIFYRRFLPIFDYFCFFHREHLNRVFNCNWHHHWNIRRQPCSAFWNATNGTSSR